MQPTSDDSQARGSGGSPAPVVMEKTQQADSQSQGDGATPAPPGDVVQKPVGASQDHGEGGLPMEEDVKSQAQTPKKMVSTAPGT